MGSTSSWYREILAAHATGRRLHALPLGRSGRRQSRGAGGTIRRGARGAAERARVRARREQPRDRARGRRRAGTLCGRESSSTAWRRGAGRRSCRSRSRALRARIVEIRTVSDGRHGELRRDVARAGRAPDRHACPSGTPTATGARSATAASRSWRPPRSPIAGTRDDGHDDARRHRHACRVGDVVTLLGRDGDDVITVAERRASWASSRRTSCSPDCACGCRAYTVTPTRRRPRRETARDHPRARRRGRRRGARRRELRRRRQRHARQRRARRRRARPARTSQRSGSATSRRSRASAPATAPQGAWGIMQPASAGQGQHHRALGDRRRCTSSGRSRRTRRVSRRTLIDRVRARARAAASSATWPASGTAIIDAVRRRARGDGRAGSCTRRPTPSSRSRRTSRWCRSTSSTRRARRARALLVAPHDVSRVIARPFVGTAGSVRAHGEPPRLLARAAGRDAARRPRRGRRAARRRGQGGRPVRRPRHHGAAHRGQRRGDRGHPGVAAAGEQSGFLFANLVDFDQLYGHRNDVAGF